MSVGRSVGACVGGQYFIISVILKFVQKILRFIKIGWITEVENSDYLTRLSGRFGCWGQSPWLFGYVWCHLISSIQIFLLEKGGRHGITIIRVRAQHDRYKQEKWLRTKLDENYTKQNMVNVYIGTATLHFVFSSRNLKWFKIDGIQLKQASIGTHL